jgi:hypothetical protein
MMLPNRDAQSIQRRLLQGASVLLIASLASGCGVYLHDSGLETSTAEAKTSFEALNVPAMFATQRQNLRELAAREDSAVAAYAVSLRNERILSLLRPSPRAGPTLEPVDALRQRVRAELGQVYRPNTNPVWSPDELEVLHNAEGLIVRNAQGRAQTLSFIQQTTREFAHHRRVGDARTTDCARIEPVPRDSQRIEVPLPPGASRADQAYRALQHVCTSWRNERDFRTADQPDRFDIADLFGASTGQISTVLNGLKVSEDVRARAAAQAGELQAEINRALRPSGDRSDENDDDDSREERTNAAITAVSRILSNGTPLARKAGLEQLATVLEELLAAEIGSIRPSATAEPAAGEAAALPVSDTTARAAVVLTMIRAGARAVDAFGTAPAIDRAGALLIGLAKVRHDLNMAKADVALAERERELLGGQLTALLRRAAQLVQAHQILTSHSIPARGGFGSLQSVQDPRLRAAGSGALTAYVRAWDTGEIPYDVLRFRLIQARRQAALERAELTEQDYRALLKPALDTLAAYGEGGITPETIATVLSRLGIAASILGE